MVRYISLQAAITRQGTKTEERLIEEHCGELSEWLKERAWKVRMAGNCHLGFESPSLRQINSGCAQLVARTAGGREVASSSLVIPTRNY